MRIGAVIAAAGRGQRMGTEVNKQYLALAGRPILARTLDVFYNYPRVEEINVVVACQDKEYCRQNIIEEYNFQTVKLVAGGKTRRESVFTGLKAFSPAIDYVIIHDGARPLLKEELLHRIICSLDENDAVSAGVPVKDTIKFRDEEGFVEKTPHRKRLTAIQTPQAFALNLILKAHQSISLSEEISDDASLVEKLGGRVKIIEGDYENLKVTTPVDLILARAILNRREQER
ncbi:MAG: 2-C-methyl-D-erythritol 4-phosphate cytidylyltransferase [Halanaerobiales bacterium]